MTLGSGTLAGSAIVMSVLIVGCGTPREKTAPCKRPANLSSYAADCGPMTVVNADGAAALAAIDDLAAQRE